MPTYDGIYGSLGRGMQWRRRLMKDLNELFLKDSQIWDGD